MLGSPKTMVSNQLSAAVQIPKSLILCRRVSLGHGRLPSETHGALFHSVPDHLSGGAASETLYECPTILEWQLRSRLVRKLKLPLFLAYFRIERESAY